MHKIKIFFLLMVLPLLSFKVVHKYYVSVTEIEYAEDKQSLQIISRVFIDDFEKLLRERYNEKITLAVENEMEIVDFYIQKYLNEKFKIEINNQLVDLNFLGKEYEDDIMLCYLEIENIEHISRIQVVNQVLFDVFPDQQNIVRIKINSTNKSILLNKENDKGLLNL